MRSHSQKKSNNCSSQPLVDKATTPNKSVGERAFINENKGKI